MRAKIYPTNDRYVKPIWQPDGPSRTINESPDTRNSWHKKNDHKIKKQTEQLHQK